jgi:hypothetical protein
MQQSPSENVASIVTKFLTIYGTRRTITVISKGAPLDDFLSEMNPIQLFTPQFFKIYFNIILPICAQD